MDNQDRRIRAARALADISQDELAERLGIEKKWVWRREQEAGTPGRQDAKRYEMIAIAVVCGVELDYLLGADEIQKALSWRKDSPGWAKTPADEMTEAIEDVTRRDPEPSPEEKPEKPAAIPNRRVGR